MTVELRGERELALRFETFPSRARARLVEHITSIIGRLESRVQAATPVKTGKLRSEITSRVFADQPNRVAGYVQVYAPGGGSNEYAKAATLEYGTDKPRRAFERTASLLTRFGNPKRRILDRISKPAHIEAFRYLRGPMDEMKDEAYAELNAALAEAANE